jgi:hypothetical protein
VAKLLFPADERIAWCACGWGAGEEKTVSQVTGHRAHHREERCAEPMRIRDESDEDDEDELDADDEERALAEGRAAFAADPAGDVPPPSPTRAKPTNGRAADTVDATPRKEKKTASGYSDRRHAAEFTPVSTQRFMAPALLHSYYDWFCRGDPASPGSSYEGDFQTWLATLALDCLKEHWGLDFAVTIMPRTGGSNGSHPA